MLGAVLILLALPVLNTSEVRSTKFRPLFGFFYWVFVSNFLILGWIGQMPVETPFVEVGQAATAYYFIWFLIIVPFIGIIEKTLIRAKI
jgi:ubiquinol-cytochrome c reductase cytochrome b subunit